MRTRTVLDLAHLPAHGQGSASPTWWGTAAFMLIEGTGFALVVAVYLYLMSLAAAWPIDAAPPELLPGTIVTLLLLLSALPNLLLSRWAKARATSPARPARKRSVPARRRPPVSETAAAARARTSARPAMAAVQEAPRAQSA